MVDELPDSIINSPAQQQTLVKNFLTNLKVRNKLIHDRVSQSKPINMQQFIHHLLRIGSDAIRIKQEYAQLQAFSMASIRAPRSDPGTPIPKKQKTHATSNNRYEPMPVEMSSLGPFGFHSTFRAYTEDRENTFRAHRLSYRSLRDHSVDPRFPVNRFTHNTPSAMQAESDNLFMMRLRSQNTSHLRRADSSSNAST